SNGKRSEGRCAAQLSLLEANRAKPKSGAQTNDSRTASPGPKVFQNRAGGSFPGAHGQDDGGGAGDGVPAGVDPGQGGAAAPVRHDAPPLLGVQPRGGAGQEGVG